MSKQLKIAYLFNTIFFPSQIVLKLEYIRNMNILQKNYHLNHKLVNNLKTQIDKSQTFKQVLSLVFIFRSSIVKHY